MKIWHPFNENSKLPPRVSVALLGALALLTCAAGCVGWAIASIVLARDAAFQPQVALSVGCVCASLVGSFGLCIVHVARAPPAVAAAPLFRARAAEPAPLAVATLPPTAVHAFFAVAVSPGRAAGASPPVPAVAYFDDDPD